MSDLNEKYGPWAVVTGASSGIGKAFSELLAKNGVNVVVVARGKENLLSLQSHLEKQYSVKVRSIALDLAESDSAARLGEQTADLDVGLLVANAGVQTHGLFAEKPEAEELNLLALNINSPMQLSHLFIKRFKLRGKGGILYTSSAFGYQGVPYFANYAASKAYVITLAESLNVELKPFGIDVTAISPGYTNTPMTENTTIDFSKMPIPQQEPEEVARIGLNALGKKATVVPGMINKLFVWENRLLPRLWPTKVFGFLIRYAHIGDGLKTSS